jgi:large subunit ribosomal protein L5
MARMKQEYKEKVVPELMQRFKYKNPMQVPRLQKVVLNVGMGEMAHEKDLVETVREEIGLMTGQKPALTTARKAISNFKIRIGSPVGYKVTLRGDRMYEFLDKLINFCMPRIRDFRGVSRGGFDSNGNYSLGIKEQTIFPDIDPDKFAGTHGMDICIVTTAETKEECMSLLEGFGMPFTKKEKKV